MVEQHLLGGDLGGAVALAARGVAVPGGHGRLQFGHGTAEDRPVDRVRVPPLLIGVDGLRRHEDRGADVVEERTEL
ncbi:hypothetical protein HUN58_11150 [Curtobacterium sp. Csp1]|uniref:hypothetical protein n=1 Tax=unclassified Curtobacterium TaxID=257496 RepID=UPI00159981DE|nr:MULTISPECIES: hypothetical protein [unclassified Curtobacterium]QKS13470.1 hypothetical protein HUN60_10240 [Curtobacterium sp. csp3]QKS20424.1 hypothetical protein HUN58_11150 [Curtobacterium sp. Csp1]